MSGGLDVSYWLGAGQKKEAYKRSSQWSGTEWDRKPLYNDSEWVSCDPSHLIIKYENKILILVQGML